MTQKAVTMPTELDFTNCDREQIQYAGAIQPHGALLALHEPDLRILQVSANSEDFLGLPPEALLGQGIEVLLGDDVTGTLRTRLDSQPLSGLLSHLMSAPTRMRGDRFHLFGTRVDGVLLLEFERIDAPAQARASALYQEVHASIQALQSSQTLHAFFNLAVTRIRQITGFDRVMAYRFDLDGSGEVVAESVDPGHDTYLGLHYPAADIPEPARRLFSLSWVRLIPDVDYVPIPLVPELNPLTRSPLDLSHSFLRSVSVMHTGYLRNMGVRATLVATLLKEGRLWGLISCMNHEAPRYLPYETRVAVEFLAHMVSLLMGAKTAEESSDYRLTLSTTRAQQLATLFRAKTLHQGLIDSSPDILTALDADGAALFAEGHLSLLGKTPSEPETLALADWLAGRDDPLCVSHHLALDDPPAAAFQEVASGLLAIRLFQTGPECLMWFRPEWRQTVNWAGNPHKPVQIDAAGGESRLLPRTSFALWQEQVAGQARRWLDCEIEHATELRHSIVEFIVSHTERLSRLNSELVESNQELDTFAYAASHDLKEPLRGIHNFAEFLRDEEGERLSEQGQRRLATILRLTRRMDDLIESLLQYSRVGRIELDSRPVDLNEVLALILESLQPLIQSRAVQTQVLDSLPVTACDRVRVTEIFSNLISNAIKYNDRADKWVAIGCDATRAPPVFFVRDNGIGISPKHFVQIFQIFRRLHGRDEYGGGTGAGLTITRKAIERHGGTIWLESTPGEGSTFYFTLAPALA
jgi:light-regulated signal transduction histidine kinase (bacteriophytochrome)